MRLVESRNGTSERTTLIGMISDKTVISRIASKWDGELFASTWENKIGEWCVTHFNQFGDAPKKAIENHFNNWAETTRDKDSIQAIENLLSGLSEEHESETDCNPDHILDVAGKLFRTVKLRKTKDKIDTLLTLGKLDEAEAANNQHQKVELGSGAGCDLWTDHSAVAKVFREQRFESLIPYPGQLGQFFAHQLCRNSFIAFQAPEKGAKSFFLQDLAWRATCNRKRVAYFDVGDNSEEDVHERFIIRASAHPTISQNGKWPCTIRIPKKVKQTSEGYECEYSEKTFDEPLNLDIGWEACRNVVRARIRSEESYFRTSVHPSGSCSINDIKSILRGWERNDWFADILVIDYSDILAPINKRADKLEQINDSWLAMRALSLEKHILVATATQANREGYKAKALRREHTSGDKRKNGHVTMMSGILQNDEESERQIIRLNTTVRRKGLFGRSLYVGTCLALANPTCCSI